VKVFETRPEEVLKLVLAKTMSMKAMLMKKDVEVRNEVEDVEEISIMSEVD